MWFSDTPEDLVAQPGLAVSGWRMPRRMPPPPPPRGAQPPRRPG